MDVTLTEQIKLTFPSDGQRKEAGTGFSAGNKTIRRGMYVQFPAIGLNA